MTIKEFLSSDKNMPEETMHLVGYFYWKYQEPHATLMKDKEDNIIILPNEAVARKAGEKFAEKFCKFGIDDKTVFCSVVLRITRGGGKEMSCEELTCYTAYREFSYAEAKEELGYLFNKGMYEI